LNKKCKGPKTPDILKPLMGATLKEIVYNNKRKEKAVKVKLFI
jgi:hypothetical protein